MMSWWHRERRACKEDLPVSGNLSPSKRQPSRRREDIWPTAQYQLGRLYPKRGIYAKARTAFERCQIATRDDDLRSSAFTAVTEVKIARSITRQGPFCPGPTVFATSN